MEMRGSKRQCCWQKACIMGYFPILLSLLPAPSVPHQRSQSITAAPFDAVEKKNVIALPCLCLPCIVTSHFAARHYTIQQTLYDTTLQGAMSPGRRFL